MAKSERMPILEQGNSLVFGVESPNPSEMTPVELLEHDLQILKADNTYNYAIGCLCGDVTQEMVDIYGVRTTAFALDRLSSKKLPTGARVSLYHLIKEVLDIIGQDSAEGRAAMVDNVRAQLGINRSKFQERLEADEIGPEEAEFQLYSGYDPSNGYVTKRMFVDQAAKDLGRPDFAVTLGSVVHEMVNGPIPSSIGIAMELGGFDRVHFADDLEANGNDMLRAYLANKHKLEVRREELVHRATEELRNIGEMVQQHTIEDNDGMRQLRKLRDVIYGLGIGRKGSECEGAQLVANITTTLSVAE